LFIQINPADRFSLESSRVCRI